MHRSRRHAICRQRQGFTLVELIAVIVILAILAGVALPRFLDTSDQARNSADAGAIAGIQTAMHAAHVDHRVSGTASAEWIDHVDDIGATMQLGELPTGITINGNRLVDQRGNQYVLVVETATTSARLIQLSAGSGGGK